MSNMNSDRTKSVAVVSSILAVAVLLLGGGVLGLGFLSAHATSSTPALNSVQISVQTSGNAANLTLYDLTIYNSTGYPVVTTTSNYPGFGAQLPSGKYLFTVLATQQYYYYPVAYTGESNSSGSAVASASGPIEKNGSAVMPIYQSPPYQFGYSVQTISGSQSIAISTASLYGMPTSSVSVHVSYANGTAASGAYVDAELVGGSYYGYANNWVTSGQTGSDGSVKLQVPSLPFELSAYSSVMVNVPQSLITYKTTIGGESVNVTAYFNPYVSLSGSQLVIPPQTSVSITMHVQQDSAYPVKYGTMNSSPTPAGAPTASGASPSPAVQNGAVAETTVAGTTQDSALAANAGSSQPQLISPLVSGDPSTVTTTVTHQSNGSSLNEVLSIAVIAAVVLSAISIALVMRRKPAA